ncbi:MAG: hypothetical protein NTY22_05710 [Proteobacteria bacterium]|nr:hypothetical protein [Pseudomonadota bacterium]
MTSSNNRKFFTKYQLGNMLFQLLCAGFGALAFLYLSFTIQFFYEITPMHGTYYLFLTGIFLLIWGILFRFFKGMKKFVSFPIFVYVGLGLFLLLYLGSIFIHAYPSMAVYLFIPIYLALGMLLFMFLSLWKREGGVKIFIYFAAGILLSGILNKIYSSEPLYIIYAVKAVFLLFCILIIAHTIGIFGIFKERRISFIVATAVMLVIVFYPLNLNTLIDELSRYKWQKTTQILGSEYDYVDSYQTFSRKIDVFISNNNFQDNSQKNSKGSFSFVENGTPVVYSYPLKPEHELSFYYSLVQQKDPLKNILVVGDIPVGLVDLLNKLPDNIEIDYMPIDTLYPVFWSHFMHEQIFDRIKIISNNSQLLSDYNLIYLFPPNIKGVGSFPYVNKSQFSTLRKHISVGSLVVVTSKLFPVGIENIIRNNIDGLFKNITYLKLTSDINYIIASDISDNITVNPTDLKYRFLSIGMEGDYSRIKIYFENNRGVTSNYFGVMDDASFDKSSMNKKFLIWSSALGITVFLFMFFFLNSKVSYINTWIHSSNTVIIFAVLGGIFSVIALYYQKMFIDLHTTFSSLFSMFVLGITIGIISGWFISRKIAMDKVFLWGLSLFFTLMLSWIMLMNYISNSDVLVLYLIWTGLSSFIILGTIYWYRFFLSLDNMFRLLSLIFIGLGIGAFSTGIFDFYGISLTAINYTISAWVLFIIVYNMTMIKEKKL